MPKSALAVWMIVLVFLAGCGEPEVVEPVDPELPPPPTPQEVAQSIITEVNLDMPIPPAGQRFPIQARNEMIDALQAKKNIHNADVTGKEALEHVRGRIDKRIREFSGANAWQHVMVFIELHEVLSPDSTKYASLRDDAIIQLKKPQLKLHGLPVLDGRQVIVMTFYIPATDETHKEWLSIGDQIYGMKLVDVFGNNRGVTMEYLETGERFVSYLPGRA